MTTINENMFNKIYNRLSGKDKELLQKSKETLDSLDMASDKLRNILFSSSPIMFMDKLSNILQTDHISSIKRMSLPDGIKELLNELDEELLKIEGTKGTDQEEMDALYPMVKDTSEIIRKSYERLSKQLKDQVISLSYDNLKI